MISVSDNGEGIDPVDQKKLFKVFGVIKDIKRGINTKGIGLGLAICKLIVQRFGGKIDYYSEKGVGSTFFFTFKVQRLNPTEAKFFMDNHRPSII